MKKIIIAFIVLCLAGAIGYGVNEYNIYSSTTMKKTEVVLYEQDVLHVALPVSDIFVPTLSYNSTQKKLTRREKNF